MEEAAGGVLGEGRMGEGGPLADRDWNVGQYTRS